ncbi:MAG: tetratricopeptide repeat protein [Planctomycetes bacterium]|nr:tetratricopeptide repeat protein [Planctomycetota bacterium]
MHRASRPSITWPVLVLSGAASASLLSASAATLAGEAGVGPYGWSPHLAASSIVLSLAFLLARGIYRVRIHESMPARIAAFGLLASGLTALLTLPAARSLGSLVAALSKGETPPSPGFFVETVASLLLVGPWIGSATLVWASGAPSTTPARLGPLLVGGAAGLLLDAAGWVAWTGGHPVLPAGILVALGGFLLSPGRREAAEEAAWEARGAALPESQAGGARHPLALPLVLCSVAFSLATLGGGLLRLVVLAAGRERSLGASALLLAACAGAGCLVVPATLRRHATRWRPLAFFSGLSAMVGLAAATLGDRLPAAYLEVLARYGLDARGEIAAASAVSAIALAGFGLCAGAAAGAAASMERGAVTALACLCSAAGFMIFPALAAVTGVRGAILVGSVALLLAAGGASLLAPGPLPGRASRAIALLAAGALLLGTGRPWDLRRFLAAPSQHPDRYLALGSSILQRRTGRDRALAYVDGPRSSAGIFLLDGHLPAAFLDGRARAMGGHDSQRSLVLAGHLPFLLGGDPGRLLVAGPLLGPTWEAMALHEPAEIDLVARDATEARLLLSSGEALRPGGSGASTALPRILSGDLRRVLSSRSGTWDRIVLPPGIDAETLVPLFTPSILRLVRGALSPGGIAVAALPLDALDVEGILAAAAAFEDHFPGGRAWFTRADLVLAGGAAPLVPDLGRMGAVARRPAVASSLSEIGLEDPLRILALQIAPSRLAGGVTPDDVAPVLRRAASRARMRPVAAENIRALVKAHSEEAPGIDIPGSYPPEARRSVEQRLAVLREAARLVMSSRLAHAGGDEEVARSLADDALSKDSADLEARSLLSRGLVERASDALEAGDVAAARADFTRALALDPLSVQALGDLAWIRYADGDRAGAEQLLRRAAGIAPWIAQTHYRLGLLRYEAGDRSGAMESLNTAHVLDPYQPEPLLLMGDMARLEGDTQRARRLYEKALETGTRTAEIRAALAEATLDDGEIDKGLEEIESALREKPGDPEALMTRARIRLRRGEREAARRDLLAAVATGGPPYRARALLEPSFRDVLLGGEGPRE